MGLEPTRLKRHLPLKQACLPVPASGSKKRGEKTSLDLSFPLLFVCDSAGIRTQDPNIKSVVLYQLSYEINIIFCFPPLPLKRHCKVTYFFLIGKRFFYFFLPIQSKISSITLFAKVSDVKKFSIFSICITFCIILSCIIELSKASE